MDTLLFSFKRQLCTALLLLSCGSVAAQTLAWERKLYASEGVSNAVLGSEDADGLRNKQALHVAGNGEHAFVAAQSNGLDADWLIVKRNAAGDELWRSVLVGRASGDDRVYAIARGSDGDYVAAGYTTHEPESGAKRCTIAKFNGTTGATLWRTTPDLGLIPSTSTSYEETRCFGLSLDSNDSIYVVGAQTNGASNNPAAGNKDGLVAKVNAGGTVLWSRAYLGLYAGTALVPRNNEVNLVATSSVAETLYIAMREHVLETSFSSALRRLDGSGAATASRSLTQDRHAAPRALAVSADGARVAVGGETASATPGVVGTQHLVSADLNTLIYQGFKQINGGASRTNAAAFDAAGNAVFSGTSYVSQAISPVSWGQSIDIAVVTPAGVGAFNSINRPAGHYSESLHHTIAPDGTIYLAGLYDAAGGNAEPNTISVGSATGDFMIAKIPASGGVLNMTTVRLADVGNGGRDRANAIGIDAAGDLYVAGMATTPASATTEARSRIAVVKLTPPTSGNFSAASFSTRSLSSAILPTVIDAGIANTGKRLATVDSDGNLYVATNTFTAAGSDIVVAKYDPLGAVLWKRRIDRTINGGAESGNDIAHAIALTEESPPNLFVVGQTEGIGNGENTPYKALAMKLRGSDGQVLWERATASTQSGTSAAFYAVESAQIYNDLVAVGVDSSARDANGVTSSSNGAWLLQRLNGSTGVVQWARSFEESGASTSPLEDRATHLILVARDLSNITLYIGGSVNRGTNNGSGANNDIRLMRIEETGGSNNRVLDTNPTWIQSDQTADQDRLHDLLLDRFTVFPNTFDRLYFVATREPNGGGSFARIGGVGIATGLQVSLPPLSVVEFFGDSASGTPYNTARSLALDFAAKHLYVAGSLDNAVGGESFAVLKFDTALAELWRKSFNGAAGDGIDAANAIRLARDGPVVTGELFDQSAFMATLQLRKSDGEMLWGQSSNSAASDYGVGVVARGFGAFAERHYAVGMSGEPDKAQTVTVQAMDRALCTLKVDGRGFVPRATTDGLIILRHLVGLMEPDASNGTTPLNDMDERDNLVNTLRVRGDYDVDSSGGNADFKDALVILRYLLGFKGNSVTDGIGLTGSRNQWEPAPPTAPTFNNSIRVYLQSCGTA